MATKSDQAETQAATDLREYEWQMALLHAMKELHQRLNLDESETFRAFAEQITRGDFA